MFSRIVVLLSESLLLEQIIRDGSLIKTVPTRSDKVCSRTRSMPIRKTKALFGGAGDKRATEIS